MDTLYILSFIATVAFLCVSSSSLINDESNKDIIETKSYFFVVAMGFLTVIFLSLSMVLFVEKQRNEQIKMVKPQKYEIIKDTLYKKVE